MSAKSSAVELDFFRMEKETPTRPQKLFDRKRSFRDIQGVISKIDPEVLKTLISSCSLNKTTSSLPSTPIPIPKDDQNTSFPSPTHSQLPLYHPTISARTSEKGAETAPLTIFYNGTVAVFDVPKNKADNILKLAEEGISKAVKFETPEDHTSSNNRKQLLQTLNGDLPIARRKSLQRFLEKRKERLAVTVSPYASDHKD